jgi:hypothetical protein
MDKYKIEEKLKGQYDINSAYIYIDLLRIMDSLLT